MPRPKLTIDEHLAMKVDKAACHAGCWLWKGGLNEYGYPVFGFEGRTKQAHRLMWEKANGTSATGFILKHICKEHSCCNPDHLIALDQRK